MTREPYLIGYARVSKRDDQLNAAQWRALDAAACKQVFEETASGGTLGSAKASGEDRAVA